MVPRPPLFAVSFPATAAVHFHYGMTTIASIIGFIITAAALAYLAAAITVVRRWASRAIPLAARPAPVTLLKPLCGDEPLLYENLRSFCEQDYPEFQIVFGVRDRDDPAAAVAQRLIDEFPERDIRLIIDGRSLGSNDKVSNLANMIGAARHAWLVIADSDIHVGRDYLRAVIGPLDDPAVGLVTCLYRARPVGRLWSRLGAQFINEGFLPSVLVGRALGATDFGFGATLALRREVLERIGGFPALADYLADDYRLGALTRRLGLRTVLSPYLVETVVHEPSLPALFAHELRWQRTIRLVRPGGHAGSVFTYALPVSLIGALLIASLPWSVISPLLVLVLRLVLYFSARSTLHLSDSATAWLVPFRDLLSFIIWSVSFLRRRVRWRQRQWSVRPDGRLIADKEP
jgi:ceramide glucosyltransferase